MPTDTFEAARWACTRRRERLLTGTWDEDLEQRLFLQFGPVRRGAVGPRSKALCLYKRVCEELAVLYNEQPDTWHEGGEYDEYLSQGGLLYEAGLWPGMRKFQVYTLGDRQGLKRIGWEDGRLTFQRRSPATVLAWSSAADPGKPIRLQALTWFPSLGGKGEWAWETWDIADPDSPWHGVLEFDARTEIYNSGADVTVQALGESYDDYPWRFTRGVNAGRPFMPWVLYHAEIPDALWDPFSWEELVDGSLDVACQATYFQHLQFRASWPQRVLVDGEVQGVKVQDTAAGARQDLPADATSALMVKTDKEMGQGRQAQVVSWAASGQREFIESMDDYTRMASDVAGIDAAHIARGSGDAWSGAALSVSRDGKREAQAVYGPQFRRGDEELLAKAAAVANIFGGYDLPEDGWRVRHKAIPMSPQERKALREHHAEQIALGMMSHVDAMIEQNPGMTRDQAKAELARIAEEKAAMTRPTRPTSATGTTSPDDAGATT